MVTICSGHIAWGHALHGGEELAQVSRVAWLEPETAARRAEFTFFQNYSLHSGAGFRRKSLPVNDFPA